MHIAKIVLLMLLAASSHAMTCKDLGYVAAHAAVDRDNGITVESAVSKYVKAVSALDGELNPDEMLKAKGIVAETVRAVYASGVSARDTLVITTNQCGQNRSIGI